MSSVLEICHVDNRMMCIRVCVRALVCCEHCYHVSGDQNISPELLEAFDLLLSTVAAESQAGREAIEDAGGIVLTRLQSIYVIKSTLSTRSAVSQ